MSMHAKEHTTLQRGTVLVVLGVLALLSLVPMLARAETTDTTTEEQTILVKMHEVLSLMQAKVSQLGAVTLATAPAAETTALVNANPANKRVMLQVWIGEEEDRFNPLSQVPSPALLKRHFLWQTVGYESCELIVNYGGKAKVITLPQANGTVSVPGVMPYPERGLKTALLSCTDSAGGKASDGMSFTYADNKANLVIQTETKTNASSTGKLRTFAKHTAINREEALSRCLAAVPEIIAKKQKAICKFRGTVIFERGSAVSDQPVYHNEDGTKASSTAPFTIKVPRCSLWVTHTVRGAGRAGDIDEYGLHWKTENVAKAAFQGIWSSLIATPVAQGAVMISPGQFADIKNVGVAMHATSKQNVWTSCYTHGSNPVGTIIREPGEYGGDAGNPGGFGGTDNGTDSNSGFGGGSGATGSGYQGSIGDAATGAGGTNVADPYGVGTDGEYGAGHSYGGFDWGGSAYGAGNSATPSSSRGS